MIKEDKLSHNVYCEDSENELRKLPNYLIVVENYTEEFGNNTEIIPCQSLTATINIARNEKKLCTIYETISSKGHFAKYMCDISHGIL